MEEFNLNQAKFADELGIQRSAVSHLISGRNKPSLDMIEKILYRYPEINALWLATGQGSIFGGNKPDKSETPEKVPTELNLFSEVVEENIRPENNINADVESNNEKLLNKSNLPQSNNNNIEKIVIFFSDKTFEVFNPKN